MYAALPARYSSNTPATLYSAYFLVDWFSHRGMAHARFYDQKNEINMQNTPHNHEKKQQIAEFCGFWGDYLHFFNTFGYTINSMRALMGWTQPSALFYCESDFACVPKLLSTHGTHALKMRSHNRKNSISARARNCLSLFFLGGLP